MTDIAALKEAAEAIKSSDYHDLDAYLSAANPSTILSLIASHEALAEALRWAIDTLGPNEDYRADFNRARAALQSIQPVEEKQS